MEIKQGEEKIRIMLRKNLIVDKRRSEGLPSEFPDFDLIVAPAWREIRYCFESWLDWGVVLLAAALLEYAVKDRAWNLDNPNKKWDGKDRKKYFKKYNVESAIDKCFKGGLINEKEAEKLRYICLNVRDQMSHMNIMTVGKDKIYPSIPVLNISTGLLAIREKVEALDNPFSSKFAFWEKINNLSIELINDTYALLNSLYRDVIERYKNVCERQKKGDYSDGGAIIGTW